MVKKPVGFGSIDWLLRMKLIKNNVIEIKTIAEGWKQDHEAGIPLCCPNNLHMNTNIESIIYLGRKKRPLYREKK